MKQKILMVEDEPGLVLTLCDRLMSEGYDVDSREDGESGLEQALAQTYDLIMLTLCCPKRAGSTSAASCAKVECRLPC